MIIKIGKKLSSNPERESNNAKFYLRVGDGYSESDPQVYSKGVLKGIYASKEEAIEEMGEGEQVYELFMEHGTSCIYPFFYMIEGNARNEFGQCFS